MLFSFLKIVSNTAPSRSPMLTIKLFMLIEIHTDPTAVYICSQSSVLTMFLRIAVQWNGLKVKIDCKWKDPGNKNEIGNLIIICTKVENTIYWNYSFRRVQSTFKQLSSELRSRQIWFLPISIWSISAEIFSNVW